MITADDIDAFTETDTGNSTRRVNTSSRRPAVTSPAEMAAMAARMVHQTWANTFLGTHFTHR